MLLVIYKSLLLIGLILAVGTSSAETTKTIQSPAYPPYIYEDENGNVTGLFADFATEALKRAGVNSKISIVPWARAYYNVAEGMADILMPAIKTRERENIFFYPSEPLYVVNFVLFKKKDTAINWNGDITSLANYRLASVRNIYISREFSLAMDQEKIDVYKANDFESMLNMLVADRVHAIVMPELSAEYLIKKNNYTNIQKMEPALRNSPIYLAFTKGERKLAQEIGPILKQMAADGFMSERLRHCNKIENSPTAN